mgnify:CR=1 FL=1
MTTDGGCRSDWRVPVGGCSGNKLRGRVAFVTGGTRGIGAAISKSLASQGATVAAGYGRNTEQAQKFLAELSAASDGAEVSVHQGDVASADDCRRTIREVIDRHGRLDILINNAGITIDKTVAKMTEDEWNKVIAVNLSGAFFLAQAALAHMLERGSGRIVMVSSVIGEMGAIGQANYAASKAGLFGLTKTLAREACFQMGRAGKLTEDGIGVTVNAITPGYVATEMVESIPEKVLDRIKGTIPMGRLAQPWEVARVVHFLAADASGYITGQVWGSTAAWTCDGLRRLASSRPALASNSQTTHRKGDRQCMSFELNKHGKIVFPANCFPDLDFSTFESIEQLDAVIRRDFDSKAPTGTDILERIKTGAYRTKFELMRDMALNLFWANRFKITMYDVRPTRWADVPRRRDDIFIPDPDAVGRSRNKGDRGQSTPIPGLAGAVGRRGRGQHLRDPLRRVRPSPEPRDQAVGRRTRRLPNCCLTPAIKRCG